MRPERPAKRFPITPARSMLMTGLLAALLAALLAGCAHRPAPPMPPVIEVSTWGGTPPVAAAMQRIQRITLHHQGERWEAGKDVEAYLRRLQQWSRLSKRWADIPYHYVIAPDGRIYAARPLALAGDTNTDYQPQGHALVMVLGNFEEVQPNERQLQAVVDLMAGLAGQHGLGADAIASHRDFSSQTVCPGRHLYAYIENGWIQREVAKRLAAP
jgi:hypothetical protein